jgi:ATP-dependent Clp protease ATP-binding subunit ClpC
MANFNLKKSAIYPALLLGKIIFFRRAEIFKVSFLFIGVAFTIAHSFDFYFETSWPFLEFAILSFVLSLAFFEMDLFFNKHLRNPKLLIDTDLALENIDEINIADFLSYESAVIFEEAQKVKGADSHTILLTLLEKAKDMDFVFHRALIDKNLIIYDLQSISQERERNNNTYSDCFLKTIKDSFFVAEKRKGKKITPEDIFVALIDNNRYLQEVVYKKEINKEDISQLTSWLLRLKEREKENPFLYNNLLKKGSIGLEWASGYTPLLDRFSRDVTDEVKRSGFLETIGHQKEIESVERVLSRGEVNSPIIVGQPGSGRRSIIRQIAKNSFLGVGGEATKHKRFLEVDIPAVISSFEDKDETRIVIDKIFTEAYKAGNTILVINNFHNSVGEKEKMGVVDISGIISSYLQVPSFRVIGVTNYVDFRKTVEKNQQILSLMEKVEIKEVTQKETLLLLERFGLFFERKYKKMISFVALKETINLSDRYIMNSCFPEKAIDLLEETMVYVSQLDDYIVLPSHVQKIVSEKTEVPVGKVDNKEKDILLNMEKLLGKRIIGQDQAVKAVSLALRRNRAGVDLRRGLIGSFLFLGPTGTGKTETAKAIADIYFGKKKKVNRIDMSEFQSVSDVSRLIGSFQEEGVLVSGVKEDPFSLILLDEIEKAHPDILNLFLQVLDEGHITSGRGEKIDFRNCLLVATSNAGHQMISDALEQDQDLQKAKENILKVLFRRSTFRPEFVNRFDEVVLFNPLKREDLLFIADINLERIKKHLKKKDIDFEIGSDLKKKIVEISYDPIFGAREMQRVIQNRIGDSLSSAILKGELKRGDIFTINPENFKIIKDTKN